MTPEFITSVFVGCPEIENKDSDSCSYVVLGGEHSQSCSIQCVLEDGT